MAIRVVLADDHPLILNGLKDLLASEGDFDVLASCTKGEDAVRAVCKHKPDILVLDIRMPGKDGIAVLKEIRDLDVPVDVVVLTGELSDQAALASVRLGVKGIVLKEMAPHLLVKCLRKVYAGEQWVERHSFNKALEMALRREEGMEDLYQSLTPREIEIVRMIAAGLRNKEIAERLYITEGTVKIHLHNVFKKLGINSRLQLIRYAQDKGLG